MTMTKWCQTNIALYGSENDLNEIRSKIMSKGATRSFDCIVDLLVDLREFLSDEGIVSSSDKRETIHDIGDVFAIGDEYGIFIAAGDAWAPKIEAWTEYLLKCYPGVHAYFLTGSPKLQLFINTDDTGLFFEEKYYLHFCFPKVEHTIIEWFKNLDDLLKFLRPYGIIASSFSEADRIGHMIADNDDSGKACFALYEFRREIA